MARHAKKRKIGPLWISVFSILGLLFVASWVWLLLYYPPISTRAEGFIKNYLGKIFTVASLQPQQTADTGQAPDTGDPDNNQSGQAAGSTESTEPQEEEKNTKPTIRLIVYEGPKYDSASDACYYIVRAVVSGKPEPSIQFSRNDSTDDLDQDRTRIDLKRNLKSYTLTATASNSAGTAMDSLTLTWGCNSPPVISEVKVSSDIVYVNEQYELTVTASDADSASIEYKWTVAGGSLERDDLETVKWNTPAEADDYIIKVEAQDSDGGITSKSISVYVGTRQVTETTQPPDTTPPTTTTEPPSTEPEESNFDLGKKADEGGYLEYGGQTLPGGKVYAGDSENNKPCAGFISFDISGLKGKTVEGAKLTFSGAKSYGDPFEYLDAFWINVVYWGAEQISQNDFNLIGVAIQSFTNPNISCTATSLKTELQNSIDKGRSRFQVRVHFSGPYTDNDNAMDGWEYSQSNIKLNVTVR